VPDELKRQIDRAVDRQPNVLAMQVVTVHFQRNIRVETYMKISNPVLQEMYNLYLNNKVVDVPLFNTDPDNNKRMLRLINGEFVCMPFMNTISGKTVPAAGKLISTVCAIGIPPQLHGEFTGILTIYLEKRPDPVEEQILFLFARDTSVKIYDANKDPYVYREKH